MDWSCGINIDARKDQSTSGTAIAGLKNMQTRFPGPISQLMLHLLAISLIKCTINAHIIALDLQKHASNGGNTVNVMANIVSWFQCNRAFFEHHQTISISTFPLTIQNIKATLLFSLNLEQIPAKSLKKPRQIYKQHRWNSPSFLRKFVSYKIFFYYSWFFFIVYIYTNWCIETSFYVLHIISER